MSTLSLVLNVWSVAFFVWQFRLVQRYQPQMLAPWADAREALDEGCTVRHVRVERIQAWQDKMDAWERAQWQARRPEWFPWVSEVTKEAWKRDYRVEYK